MVRAGAAQDALAVTFDGPLAGARVVLAGDSTCQTCLDVAEALPRHPRAADVALLTHEPAAAWPDRITGALQVVTDHGAWRQIAHLNPPILMLVARGGRVDRLALPVSAADAAATIGSFLGSPAPEGDADAAHAR